VLVGDVAHTGIRAALRSRGQRDRPGRGARQLKRHDDADVAAVGLHLAKKLVAVLLARRELRGAELHLRGTGNKAELVAIEVIAGRDAVTDLD
jgi:hypothetical protein